MKYINVDASGKEYVHETPEQAVAATVDSPIRWKAVAIPVDRAMPGAALLHSIAEAGRCLGVAEAKDDKHAIAYWSSKVDELVAHGTTV